MKILIVDDSELLRERLIEHLAKLPDAQAFIEAENILEANKLIGELNPDVIITDIRMPGGSGIDLVKKIRATDKSTLIIVLTNYPYVQYRDAALEAGANYFFDKTNEFEKVYSTLYKISNS